jgi:hypothetical protein
LAAGQPLICVDTKGYTRYFSNEYAIVIPRFKRNEIITDLEIAILRLTEPKERLSLGENAKKVGKQFDWENKGTQIYKCIVAAYNNRK